MSASRLYSENELLCFIAHGNEDAFRYLYDSYRRKVFFIAYRMLQSEGEAEDVVQEIFTTLWVNREKLAEVVRFNSYLNTLIRNCVYNCLRKKANEETFLRETVHASEAGREEVIHHMDLKELQHFLHEAISGLPPQQRKVFELGRLNGLKHEEIATELGISRETVKKHMMGALRHIKNTLHKRGRQSVAMFALFFFY